ncbi:MAG: DUF2939 domain-containing protein [Phenylobacterium sp.]|uniref:DUF2939 domain-containing protein n=1 Tax=Phenylobacterium sp. TaxID=1871053 RepID=UPI002A29D1A5|nr:DUF2939 domain-containing protein [Phenylobacterium sp.]MDD3836413.1 DUF2939 domain-containing protein [Phenylobacterium sp.]MDX9998619.1 DUF2939 domain-containing protein [Phenylobacterium sp.]
MPRLAALLAAVLLLAGCATVQRYDAAQDVHALLVAIRDNDRATFDRHVDRRALKRQLEARLIDEAQGSGAPGLLQGLGITLVEPVAELAGELLIQPRVFRWVAESYGYRRTDPLPSPMAISPALRPIGGGRVCATTKSGGPCVLVFARSEGVWKLSGFEGDISMLRARR